ncbi:MAG TPA: cohesin domain-containing protein [Dehalococcoidia bacterium]|nr:cohesin domain-containing protein [Dehalococcoidia bacterium]
MRVRTLAALLAASTALLATLAGPPAITAQEGGGNEDLPEMTMRVVVPLAGERVHEGDPEIPVEVVAENATNIASFSFDLRFDPDVIQYVREERGDFLGSTGREVQCNPVTDSASAGIVRITCVTLRLEPAGPDGTGRLATVYFSPVGSGSTELALANARANPVVSELPDDPAAPLPEIPVSVVNASLEVEGSGGINWLLWIPIIVVGGLVVAGGVGYAALRMRGGAGKPAASATP